MRYKAVGIWVMVVCISWIVSGCGDRFGDIELRVFHFSTEDESQGNGGSEGFRTMLTQWDEANEDVVIKQEVLENSEYKAQIAQYASEGELPDVFLLQGMNTKEWAEKGLILDLTEYVYNSPYAAYYTNSYFTPFTVEDKIYGFPALTGGTCTVVVYDSALWLEAGYESFPNNWADIEEAAEVFKAQGIYAIAFGNSECWQANSCFLSTLANRYTGSGWFRSMIDRSGAAFTDDGFVAALAQMQRLFVDTTIFNEDFNEINNKQAREYYVSGEAAAFIGGNWDVSYLQSVLEGTDKYSTTKFAVLPQPAGATYDPNGQNIGLGYAIAINAELADDPERLEKAVELARYITGPEFSDYVAKNYALSGLTKVSDVDLSAFDEWTQEFYNWSYVETTPCEIYDSYLTGAVWDAINQDLQKLLDGQMTPEELATNAQMIYENSYFAE